MNESSEKIKNNPINKVQQIVYIILLIAPLFSLLILLILQFIVLDEMIIPFSLFENSFLNFFLFALTLLSIGNVLFTHLFIIPLARKEDDIQGRFSKNLIMLACGGTAIGVYGLILGILWYSEYNFIPFLIIHGTSDPTIPIENSRNLVQYFKNGRLEEIFDTDHGFTGNIEKVA